MNVETWAAHVRDEQLSHGHVRLLDAGDGPPLLLLHGLGGNWQNWLGNLPGLTDRHRVIAPDLPGFGRSEPFRGAVTVPRLSGAIVELLDRLEVPHATFVGNSMGGLLTIETAAAHPARVAGAVLVCSGGIPLTTPRYRLALLPLVRVLNRGLRFRLVRGGLLGNDLTLRALAATVVSDPARISSQRLRAALSDLGAPGLLPTLRGGRAYDARPRARQVSCPTQILWGREDRLLPLRMGEELHRLIPQSRLTVWDRAGHGPMIEYPERFNELVATFADRMPGADHGGL